MLAAGAAWRAERGLVIVSRITRRAIERRRGRAGRSSRSQAEGTELGLALDDEAARGAGAPFGWIEALDLPARSTRRAPPRSTWWTSASGRRGAATSS